MSAPCICLSEGWLSATAWETVTEQPDSYTERLKVPGGWLYKVRSTTWHQSPEHTTEVHVVNLAFVPHPHVTPS